MSLQPYKCLRLQQIHVRKNRLICSSWPIPAIARFKGAGIVIAALSPPLAHVPTHDQQEAWLNLPPKNTRRQKPVLWGWEATKNIRDTTLTQIETNRTEYPYAQMRKFYISTTQYNILRRIWKGLRVRIRHKLQKFYRNLTNYSR